MIEATYNYLTTNLTHRYNTRYSIHKKSELRTIYNTIVKLNKQSPLYMFQLSVENQIYALGLKDSALGLNSVLSEYDSSNTDSVFQLKKAVSSDSSVAYAEILEHDYKNLPDDFTLKIEHLAQGQTNAGHSRTSDSVGLPEGIYRFTADVDDNLFEFQFHVSGRLTNEENMKQLADQINQSDIGINVSVSTDRSQGTSRMILDSENTGAAKKLTFAFQDVSSPNADRGIVNYFELNHTVKYPSNASFLINGVRKESLSNSFTYNRSVRINLNSASEDEISIGYSADNDRILDEVETVVTSYNHLISVIKDNSATQKRAGLLLKNMDELLHDYESELETCGLNITPDHLIEIDRSLAYTAAKEGDIEKILTEPDGFVSNLKNRMVQIIIDPMDYIDKTIVTYPDITKQTFPNPYITSMYSGMLYNYYC